jgi:acetyl-CoA carboxylase biotin carboxyl carrier protein
MGLSDEDVREILRIIDESELDELQIVTRGFKLHLRRGGANPPPSPEPQLAAEPQPAARARPSSDATRTIDAPMLGIFYVADGPGQKPFVEVGDPVEPETVVCIIEVMKMMNSIRAGVAGTVVEVCAENGQRVEEGEALFRVEPG